MKIRSEVLEGMCADAALTGYATGDVLFLDIETTGFSSRHDFLYLIGAVVYREDRWQAFQWFSERPEEEPLIIEAFLEFSASYPVLIHFNGTTFDLPFLEGIAKRHKMACTLREKTSVDLYRELRPLKKLFGLEQMTLASLQRLTGCGREDAGSGRDMIQIYQRYVSGYFPDYLEVLLQHNREDLRATVSLVQLLAYRRLLEGGFSVSRVFPEEDHVNAVLVPEHPLPGGDGIPETVRFKVQEGAEGREMTLHLAAGNDPCMLQVPAETGVMRHYLPEWKEYYYLPEEDMVIHRSVAVYVDKRHRVPATAENCFVKKEGCFLFQTDSFFTPVFRKEGRKGPAYFELTPERLSAPSALVPWLRALVAEGFLLKA